MKNLILVLFAGMIFRAHAQTDDDYRKQADFELLKEEPKSALFYINRITQRSSEDKLREIEASLLRTFNNNAIGQLDSFSKNDAIRKSVNYIYLSALVQYQQRDFREAILLLQQVNKRNSKAQFLAGKAFLDLNEVDSANSCFNRALRGFQQDSVNSYVQIAKVRNSLGRTQRRKGNLQLAINQYKIAIDILSNSPLEKWDDLGKVYNNVAIAYEELGDYHETEKNYNLSASVKDKFSTDSINRATTYLNLASFYSDYNNFLKSEGYHKKAIDLIDSTKSTSRELLSSYYNNYGLILMQMREYNRAASHFQRSIKLLREINANEESFVPPTNNLAICQLHTKEYSKAKATLSSIHDTILKMSLADHAVLNY